MSGSENDLPAHALTASAAIAAGYALGFYPAAERAVIEVQLERNPDLLRRTVRLLETATDCLLGDDPPVPVPAPEVKEKILRSVDLRAAFARFVDCLEGDEHDSVVIADPERRVVWVSPPFSEMCGYSLDELRGERLSRLLHGARTDQEVVQKVRTALAAHATITAELINYHKNGNPYLVRFTLNPVKDAQGRVRGFISLSKELAKLSVAP